MDRARLHGPFTRDEQCLGGYYLNKVHVNVVAFIYTAHHKQYLLKYFCLLRLLQDERQL